MKAISFLGTANYSETTYALGSARYQTRFFPAAVAHFVRPDRLLICATPTVEKHPNLAELGQRLDDQRIAWEVVKIPEGHSESDLWTIFDKLTASVQAGEHVVFDVTHSFRSLPFLAFLAVAYLKAAKQVEVERVLYGAWEARDEANQSPVFDLTPFTVLLDWLTATNRFVETGDGQALAGLLKAGMPAGVQMKEDLTARTLGHHLRLASEAIDSVSLALRVTRPIEVMQSASQFNATLSQAAPDIARRARPFALLAERMATEYGQFALENPSDPAAFAEGLRLQLGMIDWYIRRRHVVQAATLAREWLVSVLAYRFGQPMFSLKNGREHVEAALNRAVDRSRNVMSAIEPSPCDADLAALPQANDLARLWSQMRELRNDIAHVGMNSSPKPASLLKQNVEALYPRLVALAHDLLPENQPTQPHK